MANIKTKTKTLYKVVNENNVVIHVGYTSNIKGFKKWVKDIKPFKGLSAWEMYVMAHGADVEVVKQSSNVKFIKAARKHLVEQNRSTLVK